jgi:hypothetical protein
MGKLARSLVTTLLVRITASAWAGSYQYITPLEGKQKIAKRAPMTLVDIQVEEEFSRHHIVGPLRPTPIPSSQRPTRRNWAGS